MGDLIKISDYRQKKLNIPEASQVNITDQVERIKRSIERINNLMKELSGNP